ncbi:MAG: hypothetical protein ABIR66_04355 [Saprospiraceae bacterium]
MKKKEETKVNKKRVVKDYENLSPELVNLMHASYPDGFEGAMISFFDRDGKRVSAIPFETDDIYYLIRMVEKKAKPAEGEDEIEAELEVDAPVAEEDDLFAGGDEAEETVGDVSLDEIENAENSFADDDSY